MPGTSDSGTVSGSAERMTKSAGPPGVIHPPVAAVVYPSLQQRVRHWHTRAPAPQDIPVEVDVGVATNKAAFVGDVRGAALEVETLGPEAVDGAQ